MPIALPPVRIFEDHQNRVEFYRSTLTEIFVARGYEESYVQIDTYSDCQEWKDQEPEPAIGINIIDGNLGVGKEDEGINILKQAQNKSAGSKNIVITAYPHFKATVERMGGIYLTKAARAKALSLQIEVIEHHIDEFLEENLPTDPESFPDKESTPSDQESLSNSRNLEGVKFFIPPTDDPQPDTLLDLRFLIKRALWHATEEEEDDIFGIKSEYELSQQKGKLSLKTVVEEEMSDFLPQKLSFLLTQFILAFYTKYIVFFLFSSMPKGAF
ncbi:MAG: hypothetical protein AAFV78_03540, partial [Bacteroidota bacterium]